MADGSGSRAGLRTMPRTVYPRKRAETSLTTQGGVEEFSTPQIGADSYMISHYRAQRTSPPRERTSPPEVVPNNLGPDAFLLQSQRVESRAVPGMSVERMTMSRVSVGSAAMSRVRR